MLLAALHCAKLKAELKQKVRSKSCSTKLNVLGAVQSSFSNDSEQHMKVGFIYEFVADYDNKSKPISAHNTLKAK